MEHPEIKRLRKLIVRAFLGALLLLVIAVFIGSYQLKQLKAQIANTPPAKQTTIRQTIFQTATPLNGENGHDGNNGSNGQNGNDGSSGTGGQAGQNVTPEQIASAVAAYFEANPVTTGPKGDTGSAGLVVFIQQNPITGLFECKRGTDLSWQPLTECS